MLSSGFLRGVQQCQAPKNPMTMGEIVEKKAPTLMFESALSDNRRSTFFFVK